MAQIYGKISIFANTPYILQIHPISCKYTLYLANTPYIKQGYRIKIMYCSEITDTIPGTRTSFRGRGCPRPRSVCHKTYDHTMFVETTRPASLNEYARNAVAKRKPVA